MRHITKLLLIGSLINCNAYGMEDEQKTYGSELIGSMGEIVSYQDNIIVCSHKFLDKCFCNFDSNEQHTYSCSLNNCRNKENKPKKKESYLGRRIDSMVEETLQDNDNNTKSDNFSRKAEKTDISNDSSVASMRDLITQGHIADKCLCKSKGSGSCSWDNCVNRDNVKKDYMIERVKLLKRAYLDGDQKVIVTQGGQEVACSNELKAELVEGLISSVFAIERPDKITPRTIKNTIINLDKLKKLPSCRTKQKPKPTLVQKLTEKTTLVVGAGCIGIGYLLALQFGASGE